MPVYQRVNDECDQPVVVDERQVSSLLEERHAFRTQRQWDEADAIFRQLVMMGVLIDDKKKNWNLGSAPKEIKQTPLQKGQFVCEGCKRHFSSRNQLFKHLREPGPCCVNETKDSCESQAVKSKSKKNRQHACVAARHADAEVCLWLGDLPADWAHPKRVAQLLYRYTPRGVEQAWIKKVVKRQYKDQDGRNLGYAILCYRDAQEATLVRKALDGLQVSRTEVFGSSLPKSGPSSLDLSFAIRVRQADHGGSASRTCQGSLDPPLLEQLRPLPLSELQQRVGCALEDREALLAVASAKPRGMRSVKGVALPSDLSLRLLNELRCLRWPAKNHRPCLTSERYLVLHSNAKSPSDSYGQLRGLCSELISWADPKFHYSGIAVTKNFVASPHIDEQDKTFQFAISLGDFSGGELCIEESPSSVVVIDTRHRIACIDGRFVHWVRNYTGERYSLIFYDTSDRLGWDSWTSGSGSKGCWISGTFFFSPNLFHF